MTELILAVIVVAVAAFLAALMMDGPGDSGIGNGW